VGTLQRLAALGRRRPLRTSPSPRSDDAGGALHAPGADEAESNSWLRDLRAAPLSPALRASRKFGLKIRRPTAHEGTCCTTINPFTGRARSARSAARPAPGGADHRRGRRPGRRRTAGEVASAAEHDARLLQAPDANAETMVDGWIRTATSATRREATSSSSTDQDMIIRAAEHLPARDRGRAPEHESSRRRPCRAPKKTGEEGPPSSRWSPAKTSRCRRSIRAGGFKVPSSWEVVRSSRT